MKKGNKKEIKYCGPSVISINTICEDCKQSLELLADDKGKIIYKCLLCRKEYELIERSKEKPIPPKTRIIKENGKVIQ